MPKRIHNKAAVPKPGIRPYESRVNYVRGASGRARPARDDTYVLNTPFGPSTHRFDGTCHTDCEDVR